MRKNRRANGISLFKDLMRFLKKESMEFPLEQGKTSLFLSVENYGF
jgi:hypothetical protein